MKKTILIFLMLISNYSFSQSDGVSNYSRYRINDSITDPVTAVSDIVFLNLSTGYAVAGHQRYAAPNLVKLYKTTNYGQNWSKIWSINLTSNSNEISFSINENVGYVMVQGEYNIFYKTIDGGYNFGLISPGPIPLWNYQNVLSVGSNNNLLE